MNKALWVEHYVAENKAESTHSIGACPLSFADSRPK